MKILLPRFVIIFGEQPNAKERHLRVTAVAEFCRFGLLGRLGCAIVYQHRIYETSKTCIGHRVAKIRLTGKGWKREHFVIYSSSGDTVSSGGSHPWLFGRPNVRSDRLTTKDQAHRHCAKDRKNVPGGHEAGEAATFQTQTS